ncbi:flavonol sulfotransferase-like protein, partial [Trifolium medium]|nr:flavonol sulfotransferase-like protein [Trifolium medium]
MTMVSSFKFHMVKKNGVVNNVAGANVEDIQSESNDDSSNDQDSESLMFTTEQHKALLALLQGSHSMPSHSVNHITSKSQLGTGIVCIIPGSTKLESFILDT